MLQVILFMTLFVGVLFISHYFVYFSLVQFFAIEALKWKYLLIGVFFLLPLSYFLSSLAAHFYECAFTRALYYISGLWLGVLTALLTFSIFAWAIYGLGSISGFSIPKIWLGIGLVTVTFLYSICGVWSASQIHIKNITVPIKNLPAEWKGKKVVQFSDVHLGYVLGEKFLHNAVKTINDLKPEAVFVTGDLFDGTGDHFTYLAEDINSLQAPKGTYFITGNHETYFGLDKVYGFLAKTNMKIFHDDMVVVDGLQIIGINYPERMDKKSLSDTIKKIQNYDPSGPSILLYHAPTNVDEAKQSGIKLMLSGHTHQGQIFPYSFITSLIFKGLDYGLHTDGDFSIYTSSGAGTWGPSMRVGTQSEIVVITLE
jgi:hypothetical protein